MTGTHLSRIAQQLLRPETYELTLAPALADLQYEARDGSAQKTHTPIDRHRLA